MNPCDLDAINHQRQFIEGAIKFYTRQIEYQRHLVRELKSGITSPSWTFGNGLTNGWGTPQRQQEQIVFYEKNIHFLQFLINQYRQTLFSLKQMWDVYSARNMGANAAPMDTSI